MDIMEEVLENMLEKRVARSNFVTKRECGACRTATDHDYVGLVFHTPEDFERRDRHTAKYRCLACGSARYEPYMGPR